MMVTPPKQQRPLQATSKAAACVMYPPQERPTADTSKCILNGLQRELYTSPNAHASPPLPRSPACLHDDVSRHIHPHAMWTLAVVRVHHTRIQLPWQFFVQSSRTAHRGTRARSATCTTPVGGRSACTWTAQRSCAATAQCSRKVLVARVLSSTFVTSTLPKALPGRLQ